MFGDDLRNDFPYFFNLHKNIMLKGAILLSAHNMHFALSRHRFLMIHKTYDVDTH